ncbi:hypothetical protein PI125_g45 [Phytophthora idaei]|nr:hypothetical protein PI125_g45 [Phytophthora idaei]
MYAELVALAHAKLSLVKNSFHQLISHVVKSASALRELSQDWLARKKARPLFQLQLDQSVVENVLMCEEIQLSLSGETVMVQICRIASRLSIPQASLPPFSWS